MIAEQLDSILHQKDVDVELIIRDDGSSNNETIDVLKKYEHQYNNVTVYYGENLGYIDSFMWIVHHAPSVSGCFYAFADQDDVWDSMKLCSAVSMLQAENSELPLLYYSDLNVVDKDLNFIQKANDWQGKFNRYQALMFIAIRGCTMVYNDALQSMIQSKEITGISGHDTFIALLAYWTGKVIYDDNAYINYRQTGNNLSITGVNSSDKLKKNIRYFKERFTKKSNRHEKNAKILLENFEKYITDIEDVRIVANYRDCFKNKFRLLFDKRFFSFHTSINIANIIFILLNKL